jgi:hypothetical protein
VAEQFTHARGALSHRGDVLWRQGRHRRTRDVCAHESQNRSVIEQTRSRAAAAQRSSSTFRRADRFGRRSACSYRSPAGGSSSRRSSSAALAGVRASSRPPVARFARDPTSNRSIRSRFAHQIPPTFDGDAVRLRVRDERATPAIRRIAQPTAGRAVVRRLARSSRVIGERRAARIEAAGPGTVPRTGIGCRSPAPPRARHR